MTNETKDETLDERIQRGLKDGTIKLIDQRTIDSTTPADTMEERINAAGERRMLQNTLRNYAPPAATWWTRSVVRAFLRWAIGLSDDVQKGELFERLVASNTQELSNLVKGLRRDVEALQRELQTTTLEGAETRRRLVFYEQHNDSLRPTYAKLRRFDASIAEAIALENAKKQQAAVKQELVSHAHFGELIDCRECRGSGEVRGEGRHGEVTSEICETCHGSGVEPNPEYTPPTEENHGDGSQEGIDTSSVERHGPQLVE